MTVQNRSKFVVKQAASDVVEKESIRLFIQRRTLVVRHVYWSISAFNKEWYIVHTALNELSTGGKLVRLGVLTVRKFRHQAA